MIDKDFEMQSEPQGPAIMLLQNAAKKYDENALSDLYKGVSLGLAISQYKDAKSHGKPDKEAFLFAVWCIERMYRKLGTADDDIMLPDYEDTGNDYRPERLADLLSGDDLKMAQDWYEIALCAPGATDAQAFIRSIRSMYYEKEEKRVMKNGPDPKNRLFTVDEMQIAIQFFTNHEIPIENIAAWGQGIDPYLVGNPADLDDF